MTKKDFIIMSDGELYDYVISPDDATVASEFCYEDGTVVYKLQVVKIGVIKSAPKIEWRKDG